MSARLFRPPDGFLDQPANVSCEFSTDLCAFHVHITLLEVSQPPILANSPKQQESETVKKEENLEAEPPGDLNAFAWTYAQKTGELQQDGKNVATGYSGAGPGKNNPEMENIRNVGPIP
jgi:hypothetical protein